MYLRVTTVQRNENHCSIILLAYLLQTFLENITNSSEIDNIMVTFLVLYDVNCKYIKNQ